MCIQNPSFTEISNQIILLWVLVDGLIRYVISSSYVYQYITDWLHILLKIVFAFLNRFILLILALPKSIETLPPINIFHTGENRKITYSMKANPLLLILELANLLTLADFHKVSLKRSAASLLKFPRLRPIIQFYSIFTLQYHKRMDAILWSSTL